MPIDWLVLGSAWLTGLLGGVHCVAMCGGIATGLGVASARRGLAEALLLNLGRISGYALAGAVVGGVGGGLLAVLQQPWLSQVSRLLVGAMLVLLALRLVWPNRLGFMTRPGQLLWRRLQPLHRWLLPADTAGKRFAAGMLWGWLPCGLSATVLGAAWLQASAWHGALTMLAFGFGTWVLMLPLTWSGARVAHWLGQRPLRTALAALVFAAGLLTLAAPWLMHLPGMHGLLTALGCRTL